MPLPAIPANLPLSFSAATAVKVGVPRSRLGRLVESGELEHIARGLYRRADAPLVDLDLVEVALRAPLATLCLETALAQHGLTDQIPTAVDVALPRAQRQPATAALVRWHRFQIDTFHLGRELIEVEAGLTIGRYTSARTLVDVFRLVHQEGADLAYEALRNWLRTREDTPAELLRLARNFPHVEKNLRRALEVLL